MSENKYIQYYNSPIGALEVIADELSVKEINFTDVPTPEVQHTNRATETCCEQLVEYFQGERRKFTVNINPDGTSFRKKVWAEVLQVEYGETASYMDIAEILDNTGAIRAVGNANGKNKIPIIIPCHRIIGSNGKLTGYAGGLWRKEWLLKHEKALKPVEEQMVMF